LVDYMRPILLQRYPKRFSFLRASWIETNKDRMSLAWKAIVGLCGFGMMWGSFVRILQGKQRLMNMAGGSNLQGENTWGFGQIVALLTWAPYTLEFVAIWNSKNDSFFAIRHKLVSTDAYIQMVIEKVSKSDYLPMLSFPSSTSSLADQARTPTPLRLVTILRTETPFTWIESSTPKGMSTAGPGRAITLNTFPSLHHLKRQTLSSSLLSSHHRRDTMSFYGVKRVRRLRRGSSICLLVGISSISRLARYEDAIGSLGFRMF
jgi:hypothetical protein